MSLCLNPLRISGEMSEHALRGTWARLVFAAQGHSANPLLVRQASLHALASACLPVASAKRISKLGAQIDVHPGGGGGGVACIRGLLQLDVVFGALRSGTA